MDAERGCVLKAEMAKKNLHTKRGLSNDPHAQLNGLGYTALYPTPTTGVYPRRRSTLDTVDGMFLQSGHLGRDYSPEYVPSSSGLDLGNLYSGESAPRPNLLKESQLLERSNSSAFIEVYDSASSSLSRGSSSTLLDPTAMEPFTTLSEKVASLTANTFSTNTTTLGDRGFNSALFSSESLLTSRYASLTMDTPPAAPNPSMEFFPPLGSSAGLLSTPPLGASANAFQSSNASLSSEPLISTTVADMDPTIPLARLGISGGDQNPPCNTLYVGNLPMDASEEELRIMFAQCAGYKRLCFKNKSNGPMCFVEVCPCGF